MNPKPKIISNSTHQVEIIKPGPLLREDGKPAQIGWARQARLDCNLERTAFYPRPLRFLQRLRMKCWDYYALFTPQRFFAAAIADLGYAGNVFVYTLDWASGRLHEEGKVIPFAQGVQLPRNSAKGEAHYNGQGVKLSFLGRPGRRDVSIDWPAYDTGQGIRADLRFFVEEAHESMAIVIPIGSPPGAPDQARRFYYNRKVNCLPVEGTIRYGNLEERVRPMESLGSLDWGRGVWNYRSFWNWASASAVISDGRTLGLNLGKGFGDTSLASEDCVVLQGRIHKLGKVNWAYTPGKYMEPWRFEEENGRLELTFTPFQIRVARTNLGIIFSEVHQVFGRYTGSVVTDSGERIEVKNLVGFAEEHRARW